MGGQLKGSREPPLSLSVVMEVIVDETKAEGGITVVRFNGYNIMKAG